MWVGLSVGLGTVGENWMWMSRQSTEPDPHAAMRWFEVEFGFLGLGLVHKPLQAGPH